MAGDLSDHLAEEGKKERFFSHLLCCKSQEKEPLDRSLFCLALSHIYHPVQPPFSKGTVPRIPMWFDRRLGGLGLVMGARMDRLVVLEDWVIGIDLTW